MKRKLLSKALEVERRKRANESGKMTGARASTEQAEEMSEEDSDSSDEDEVQQSESEEEEEALPAKKVKGVVSERDADILKTRKAEQSRIENIVPYRNKQRTLIFSSRGVTTRFRHLMEDMRIMLPHYRREVKLDMKRDLREINELCESRQCNNCIFFEARKRKDLYMWLAKAPNGPSVKFHVLNMHTMDELRLSGNCLKGSRPLLSFSKEFDDAREPALQVIKELFIQVLGTPRGHPKSKPFLDHVMTFTLLDGKIWFRHFQITDSTQDPAEIKQAAQRGEETTKLVEIGPRFVLNLIKVFEGGFSGRTLRENTDYISPNAQRSTILKEKGVRYESRKSAEKERKERSEVNVMPADPVRDVFRS